MSILFVNTEDEKKPASSHEVVDIKCNGCGVVGQKKIIQAKRSSNEKGYGYQCKPCGDEVKRLKRGLQSELTLKYLKAVDTASRVINSHDHIEFICHSCKNTGLKDFSEAKRSVKRYGFAYQCADCLKGKMADRGPEWLANIRKAAQTDEHKQRARENGRKRLLIKSLKGVEEYWDFDKSSVQDVAGTEMITATCKKCNMETNKPLKKFIEGVGSVTNGCSVCWGEYVKTSAYSKIMSSRSEPSGSEARVRQSKGAKQYWSDLDPDLRQERIAKLLETCPARESKAELEILDWVKSLGHDARKHLSGGKEIDIFVPELNIGIEYNGLYWHSEAYKSNSYHYDKMKFFAEKGITIINLFENEWQHRNDQVKSFLRSKLRKNSITIGARKVDFRWVDKSVVSEFVEKYHIQGYTSNTKTAIAGYFNDEVVVAACFSHHHRKADQWVLSRFVGKDNVTVSGALSKMSRMALEVYTDIVSWCDLRWSNGSGYKNSGWVKEEILRPDYFYTNCRKIIPKQSRRKSAVGTPVHITEHEHALADGLLRVYDCGKIRFRLTKKVTK